MEGRLYVIVVVNFLSQSAGSCGVNIVAATRNRELASKLADEQERQLSGDDFVSVRSTPLVSREE